MNEQDLINFYKEKIKQCKNKEEIIKITNNIKNLKYTSGINVEKEIKIRILEEIKKRVLRENYAQDNTQHMDIILKTINEIKGGK